MPGISVALLRPLAELLGRAGADPGAFLVEVGVDDAMAPNAYVAPERVDRALARIAGELGDGAFGLTLARLSTARPLGIFGHLVWLSGTVRDALTRGVRFFTMVSRRTELALDEVGAIATLRQRPVDPAVPRGRILTELPFATLALRAREATGGAFAVRAVRFTHAGTATAAYADVFRAPVTFGAPVDELELDRAQLDLPLASADPIVAETLEARVAQLTAAPAASPIAERVRGAVAALVARPISPELVARRLGISARTLRRQLEHDGVTLRALVDEVRRARAEALLAAGTSVKETAFAVGFSEASAFSRAYKRWTGRAPRG